MRNVYRKIVVITLLVMTIFASSTCFAEEIYSQDKKKDFTALGTEPFWRLDIFTDDKVVFSTPEGSLGFVYEQPIVSGKEYHYHLKSKVLVGIEIDMLVIVTKEKTSDSMAGWTYPYKAKVNLAGKAYEGVAYVDETTIKGELI